MRNHYWCKIKICRKNISPEDIQKIETQFEWLPVEESGEWKSSMWIKYNETHPKVNILKGNIANDVTDKGLDSKINKQLISH